MDQEAAGEAAGRAKIILIVDANKTRREYTSEILAGAGYRVLTATSVKEAEALVDTDQTIDLVVCSVLLEPGADTGVHLAEHIERSKRTNSTLLVSHFTRDLLNIVPGFFRQRHFLANPFNSEELLHKVSRLLAAKEKRDSN